MRDELDVTLTIVAVLTALLVGGTPLAVAATAGMLVSGWWTYPSRRIEKTGFNFGQTALSAGASGATFNLLGGVPGSIEAVTTPEIWIALLLAAVVHTFVNHVLVAVVIRLVSGERVRSTLKSILGTSMLLQVLYAGLAVLAGALILGIHPLAILFLVIPALVARQALLGYQRESEAYDRLVRSLLKAIEVKDGYTAGHTARVSQLCVEVARDLGFDYEELRAVRYAAKLHDVGKLKVPQSIINKPAKLDHDEFELIKEHPVVGAEILSEIEFLEPAIDGVRYHHERVDGDGYPFGVSGEELPMLARIITVCDAFDAMTTTRSYREAMELHEAFAELDRCAGTQFDRQVVDTLRAVTDRLDWQPIHEAYEPPIPATEESDR